MHIPLSCSLTRGGSYTTKPDKRRFKVYMASLGSTSTEKPPDKVLDETKTGMFIREKRS